MPLVRFGDVEAAVVAVIDAEFGADPDVTVTDRRPADLAEKLPVVVVTALGGPRAYPALAQPAVMVDVFAADRDSAVDLAERTVACVVAARGRVITVPGGAPAVPLGAPRVDVDCQRIPDPNPRVVHVAAQLTVPHRPIPS